LFFAAARARRAQLEADPAAVEQELAGLAELITGHASLWKVMTNPAVPATKKRAIVDSLLTHVTVTPVVQKTLQMLASRDRIALMPDIVEAYSDKLMDYQ
jgi:F0F1-type ATP synthase delta subunit